MIRLFWHTRTRAARAVWMLEEAGVHYERVFVDIANQDARRSAAFLAASPMGKVPAIEDGAVRMADSAAICLYLADRYPQRALAPAAADPRRGAYLFWMTYAPGAMEPAMAEKLAGMSTNRYSAGWGDFDLMVEVLEKALAQGPWLLGDGFSAADVMVGSSLHFMQLFKMLPESPVLAGYVERCTARPAWQAAMAGEAEQQQPAAP